MRWSKAGVSLSLTSVFTKPAPPTNRRVKNADHSRPPEGCMQAYPAWTPCGPEPADGQGVKYAPGPLHRQH